MADLSCGEYKALKSLYKGGNIYLKPPHVEYGKSLYRKTVLKYNTIKYLHENCKIADMTPYEKANEGLKVYYKTTRSDKTFIDEYRRRWLNIGLPIIVGAVIAIIVSIVVAFLI